MPLSPAMRDRLVKTWAGPFQAKVLPLLLRAEGSFAPLYVERNGRPSWSIARRLGILLLEEMLGLTDQGVLDALMWDARFHYALDLAPNDAYLSRRSLVDFRSRLVQHDPKMELVRALFDEIAASAIADLKLSVEVQRLDSTQIASNIRMRGRVDLFTKTLQVFLRDLKRDAPAQYAELSNDLRSWFEHTESDESEDGTNDRKKQLQQLAEWCADIVARFEGADDICSWESWELVRRLVKEHCMVAAPSGSDDGSGDPGGEPEGQRVVVRETPATGGRSLQSPFDPDATYGHKGMGYSIQIAETANNEAAEILTDFAVCEAAANDWGQTTPVIDRLETAGRKPKTLLADAGYPNPRALLEAETRRVELVAPVSTNGNRPDMIGRDRFELSDDHTVVRCPEGHAPTGHADIKHANQPHRTPHAYFDRRTCDVCPLVDQCITRATTTRHRTVELRPELLLRDQAIAQQRGNAEWKRRYDMRAGIEATNSELKRRHGLGRLRVRRRPRVVLSVTMKLTACNTKRWIRRTKTTRPA